MHLHFERHSSNARCDCPLLSLTWMGKVPDEMPDEEGWKLNRTNYYQEGWLATGNVRGVVGVTFSTCHCKKVFEEPLRTNYNLRGHRSEVSLVKWNEPYQKLASCDSSGIIFVWIKYEGRWSIELINDRNTQVRDFSWSHDGRMALICYQDGFVLVGSVAGQRYWSSMLNLEGTITCGIWTPDDQQVLFGTTTGQVIVMDVHGGMVAQVSILEDIEISAMSWSCEKFKMEEGDDDDAASDTTSKSSRVFSATERPSVLAVAFKNGLVYIMKNYDDVSPVVILTTLKGLRMEWTNAGDILAIAGNVPRDGGGSGGGDFANVVQFYMESGVLRCSTTIPYCQHPVTALTWGHNDKRLFVATGPHIHVGWVTRKVASLQLLSRLAVYNHLSTEEQSLQLQLPKRLKNLVSGLFAPTIKSCFPEPQNLRDFVCRPPSGSIRYHCTMIRHDDDLNLTSGTCYTLYLEYLGGLVPLLKGKRSSKIRPEFIIYDPQGTDSPCGSDTSGDSGIVKSSGPCLVNGIGGGGGGHYNGLSDLSDSEYDEGCASPRLQRRRRALKRLIREQLEMELRLVENLAYIDMLPETARLVEVTSNIWGTKFKLHGVASFLPANLGQVTYKTSLLHLQPRQMTLLVAEMRDDLQLEPADPTFSPNTFSEDEDECQAIVDEGGGGDFPPLSQAHLHKEAPIAPMTPKKRVTNGIDTHHTIQHPLASTMRPSTTAERIAVLGRDRSVHPPPPPPPPGTSGRHQQQVAAEADEFPYVDFTTNPELLNIIERESQSYARGGGGGTTDVGGVGLKRFGTSVGSSSSSNCRVEGSVAPTSPPVALLVSSPSRISLSSSSSNTSATATSGRVRGGDSRAIVAVRPSSVVVSTAGNPPRQQQRGAGGCCVPDSPGRSSPTTSCNKTTCVLLAPPPSVPPSSSPLVPRSVPRWAEKACDLKYIDEDDETVAKTSSASTTTVASALPQSRLLSRCRSHSVGHLNVVSSSSSSSASPVIRVGSLREMKRRLVLSQDYRTTVTVRQTAASVQRKPKLVQCGKSRSLDSEFVSESSVEVKKETLSTVPLPQVLQVKSTTEQLWPSKCPPLSPAPDSSDVSYSKSSSSSSRTSRPSSPLLHDHSSSSSTPPPTPSKSFRRPKSSLRRKSLLNSPLLSRRSWRGKVVESSDDEVNACSGDETNPNNFKDLESFQKAHIRQKLKRERQQRQVVANGSPVNRPQRREFLMHNKAPLWNENSQVYQLDFGGRVTQESAKNFQIEFRGKQVMQFGRIDGNAYTLDFQYPFTAIQAFAVALANVTQRLK